MKPLSYTDLLIYNSAISLWKNAAPSCPSNYIYLLFILYNDSFLLRSFDGVWSELCFLIRLVFWSTGAGSHRLLRTLPFYAMRIDASYGPHAQYGPQVPSRNASPSSLTLCSNWRFEPLNSRYKLCKYSPYDTSVAINEEGFYTALRLRATVLAKRGQTRSWKLDIDWDCLTHSFCKS